MYKWTIHYQYGTYSGEHIVYTMDSDAEVAISRMWRELRPPLGRAYQSERIISCEYVPPPR